MSREKKRAAGRGGAAAADAEIPEEAGESSRGILRPAPVESTYFPQAARMKPTRSVFLATSSLWYGFSDRKKGKGQVQERQRGWCLELQQYKMSVLVGLEPTPAAAVVGTGRAAVRGAPTSGWRCPRSWHPGRRSRKSREWRRPRGECRRKAAPHQRRSSHRRAAVASVFARVPLRLFVRWLF